MLHSKDLYLSFLFCSETHWLRSGLKNTNVDASLMLVIKDHCSKCIIIISNTQLQVPFRNNQLYQLLHFEFESIYI